MAAAEGEKEGHLLHADPLPLALSLSPVSFPFSSLVHRVDIMDAHEGRLLREIREYSRISSSNLSSRFVLRRLVEEKFCIPIERMLLPYSSLRTVLD